MLAQKPSQEAFITIVDKKANNVLLGIVNITENVTIKEKVFMNFDKDL